MRIHDDSTLPPGRTTEQHPVVEGPARPEVHRLAVTADTASSDDPTYMELCALLLRPGIALSEVVADAPSLEDMSWYAVQWDAGRQTITQTADPDDEAPLVIGTRLREVAPRTWQEFLRQHGVPIDVPTSSASQSVVLAARSISTGEPRTLLWCFGAISQAVPRSGTDNRFGLIVALNKHEAGDTVPPWRSLPPDTPQRNVRGDASGRVRGVDAQVRDGVPYRASSRGSGATSPSGFRFDDLSDLLRGLTLRTGDEVMRDLEAGRSLRFATHLDSLTDFVALADHLVGLRVRDDYRRQWDWIDRFMPVDDDAEADEVLHELFDRAVSDDPLDVDLAVDLLAPPLETMETKDARVVRYAMPGERQALHQGLSWPQLRTWLARHRDIPGPDILRRPVRVEYEGFEGQRKESFPLLDLLVAELSVDGQHYVVNEGEILRVETDFLQQLRARLDGEVSWSDFGFPRYEGGTEPAYLRAANDDPHLLMLDETPIRLPGETAFEVCDLLTDDGRLVFAKLKGRSSLFSHLAVQAETAAEMLKRSPAAREALLSRVAAAHPSANITTSAERIVRAIVAGHPEQVTITLLLLGTWTTRSLSSLPLVSRVRLRRTAQRITALGYRFEVAAPEPANGHLPPRHRR